MVTGAISFEVGDIVEHVHPGANNLGRLGEITNLMTYDAFVRYSDGTVYRVYYSGIRKVTPLVLLARQSMEN